MRKSDGIFLKTAVMRFLMQLPSKKKGITQGPGFLEKRFYANSVLITHFFQNYLQNAPCLFLSCKLKFFSGKQTIAITCPTDKLLKKLISTPVNIPFSNAVEANF